MPPVLAVITTLAVGHPSPRPPAKPNVVVILADDLGWGDLGCYGQKKFQTPNLDKLAAAGVRFTQCYSGSTVCGPSRCALLTGKHTGHAYVRGNARISLRAEDTTVAELLQRAGYATGCVGKWGMGLDTDAGRPGAKGFDHFYGYMTHIDAHNYYPAHLWRNRTKEPLPNVVAGGVATTAVAYAPDLLTADAVRFVRANKAKPFFLYWAPPLPHANNEKTRAAGNGNEVPSDEPYTKEPWPQPEKDKAAMITRLDRDVGTLLAELKAQGLEDNTLVLFTSDNGPHQEGGNTVEFFASSGPFRGFKRSLTDGGIRVPGIVRWPGKVKPGTVSDQVWAFWDVLPTLCDVAGIPTPAGLDGVSIAPTLTGVGTQRTHDFLYWEFHEGGFRQAVRHAQWKALRLAPGRPLELYDVVADPGETADVAAAHPAVVARIDEYLRTARTESKEFPITPPKGKK